MFIKKSIILTNKNDKNMGIAVLKLENSNSSYTYCTIKGYNLSSNEYVLGMAVNDNVIKQNIFLDKNNVYSFKIQKCDSDKLHTVLVENKDNVIYPTVWNSDTVHKTKILNTLKSAQKEVKPVTQTATIQEKTIYSVITEPDCEDIDKTALFEDDPNLEGMIDDIINEDTVASTTTESVDNELDSSTTHSTKSPTFYEQIQDQLDELFTRYPREESLEMLITDSKWVKIDYDEDISKNYVVGLIYDGNNLRYICFGVPGKMNTPPEDNLKDYSQWIPTDIKNPTENGYWVMYQDAITGKNVIVD